MVAILSNINCDHVIRRVQKSVPCVDGVGYGNVFEALFNENSLVNQQAPDQVVLLMDLRELLQTADDPLPVIDSFFENLGSALVPGRQYYVSDASYYLPIEVDYRGEGAARRASLHWDTALVRFCEEHSGCYIFPLKRLVERVGEQAFYSDKLWYIGSARYSMEGVKSICEEILRIDGLMHSAGRKVLLLDLDNTLWGGVAGEDGLDGIRLADSGPGKAYKEFQGALLELKKTGTVLAIVSKNNEADAWEIIENHPHMRLRRDDFAASKINWESKSLNIQQLAKELNVGLDSMVFIDDNPQERQEVKTFLPQVEVPEFPSQPEGLLHFASELTDTYFKKTEITSEDRRKTEQYQAKQKIEELQRTAGDFKSFLASLHIVATRRDPLEHMDRVAQIVQKTNQFNTTVTRYSRAELEEMAQSGAWRLFLYEIEDRFTNHGLCALAVVRMDGGAQIDDFIMSCRVMGRNLEYGILDDIERSLSGEGISRLGAVYRKGPKNAPVEKLYEQAGYRLIFAGEDGEEKQYQKDIPSGTSSALFEGEVRGFL